ncbi:MAG: hypothetical protein C0170_02815, partial [Hydrogenobaculum sp.]
MNNVVRSLKFCMLALSLLSPLMSLAYPSDFKDQVDLVFNVLTGKSCKNLYDAANAIYRDQANKYNADITPMTSYEKVEKICKENRFICTKDNNKLLFSIGKIRNENDGYKVVTMNFYTKNNKNLMTKCNIVINTKNTNRGYPISLPEISSNLRECIKTIENKYCVVKALNNI